VTTFYESINYDGFVKSNISPPLAGGDKGEGDNEPAEIPLLFTLTPALSRRGRGSIFDFLRESSRVLLIFSRM
jgi:hypothetical protein